MRSILQCKGCFCRSRSRDLVHVAAVYIYFYKTSFLFLVSSNYTLYIIHVSCNLFFAFHMYIYKVHMDPYISYVSR